MIPTKPENVIWTDEQWRAIHLRGTNILVSAGAGSGKTAVLSERIIEMLKSGVKLDSLIVLTFTNAAALEMKERVRKKIKAAIEEGYHFLNSELDYIDQSNIQTFDAYALSLVRKYHYALGLSKNINIGDSAILAKAKKDILDEVFNEYYEKEDERFLKLLDDFTTKDDATVKRQILKIINQIELLPNRDLFLANYYDNFHNDEFILNNIDELYLILENYKEAIKRHLIILENWIRDANLLDYLANLKESLNPLLESNTIEEYSQNLDYKKPRLPSRGDEREKELIKSERDKIDKVIGQAKSLLIQESIDALINNTKDSFIYSEIIIEITKEVFIRFDKFKYENNIYDFLDIAKMATRLLKENEEIKNDIKENTYEILIDEYQDTSDIQEHFISLISNNNVYMVGDIKQSIYRFRNANPDIFKNKYLNYSQNHGGQVIDLSANFRSRAEVLRAVNTIFERVMCEDIGGVNYDLHQALRAGNSVYDTFKADQNYNLEIYNYLKDDYIGYSRQEIEAFIIARDIKDKVDNKYLVFKNKKLQPVSFNDFVILTSTKESFDTYKKIFNYLQIPLATHKEEPFIHSDEIYVLKNILICIECFNKNEFTNDYYKPALMSLLRSYLIRLDDEVIFKIINDQTHKNLQTYSIDTYNKLKRLSLVSMSLPLDKLLVEIYREFSILEKSILIGDVDLVENKLLFLLKKANELSTLKYNLSDFIEYFEWIIEEGLDIEFDSNIDLKSNVVHMMSIHKSKGLEFSICYFPELVKGFNFTDLNDRFTFHPRYGVIAPTFNDGVQEIFYKGLLKVNYRNEEISERIRLFYVALTRSKEKMILVAPYNEEDSDSDIFLVPKSDRFFYKSFNDIIKSINNSIETFIKIWDFTDVNATKKYIIDNKEQDKIPVLENKIVYHEVVLSKQKVTRTKASKSLNSLITINEYKNIKQGNLFHKYFELIDFLNNPLDQIDSFNIDNYLKSQLSAFFKHPFIKGLDIQKVYQEHSFVYSKDDQIFRGIIDLIIETNEELYIIDYKLMDYSDDAYQNQLQTYKEYLSTMSDKPISCYLYSIINNNFKQI